MKINTLYELLRHDVEKFASRTAFDMFNGESVTYAEVGRRAAAVQEALVGAGVKAGDKVTIAWLDNKGQRGNAEALFAAG